MLQTTTFEPALILLRVYLRKISPSDLTVF